MSKISLYGLMFLILLLSVVAVPPQTNNNGLELRYPPFDSLPKEDLEIPVHVYRFNDGLVMTSNVNCSLHLYNSSLSHLLELSDWTTNHSYDYEFMIGKDNFTVGQTYGITVYCKCSSCGSSGNDLGGFFSKTFLITKDGNTTNSNPVSIALIISALLLGLVFYLIGNSLDSEHAPMKMLFTFFTLFSGMAGINLSLQLVLNSSFPLGVVNAVQTLYKLSVWAMWLTTVYLIIYLLFWAVTWLKDVKKMR